MLIDLWSNLYLYCVELFGLDISDGKAINSTSGPNSSQGYQFILNL